MTFSFIEYQELGNEHGNCLALHGLIKKTLFKDKTRLKSNHHEPDTREQTPDSSSEDCSSPNSPSHNSKIDNTHYNICLSSESCS